MRYLRRATWIYYYDRALTAAQSRTASATIALPRTASLSATTTGDAGRLDSSHHCVGLAMPFGNSATTAWTSGCFGLCQSTERQAGPGNRSRLTRRRVPPGSGYHLGTWTAACQSITTLCVGYLPLLAACQTVSLGLLGEVDCHVCNLRQSSTIDCRHGLAHAYGSAQQ